MAVVKDVRWLQRCSTGYPPDFDRNHKQFTFVNNLTIKHCDKTKVKTITLKN